MKLIFCLEFVFMLSVLAGNAQQKQVFQNSTLRSGDFLFCGSTSGALSQAIDEVTQTNQETHFSHIGIVEVMEDSVWVLHAAPKKGVYRESLRQFLAGQEEGSSIHIYRLREKYRSAIPKALHKAHLFLGQEYNFSYILNDKGMYCSEFIFELFSDFSIFELNPMTFKNPQTGEFSIGWIDHYAKLGVAIPEGEPGCNPNGMAASNKLEKIGELSF